MDAILVQGGRSLNGTVPIRGAKNATLPLFASAILADGENTFRNVPQLEDIRTMMRVLAELGAEASGKRIVKITANCLRHFEAPYDLVRTMRASVLILGPLVARYGRARVSLPGGCAIGARPIDQHLKGLEAMGVKITLADGYVDARCKRLHAAHVVFDVVTVTGTMNLMMAAALAKGVTHLENTAREPEVAELAQVLNAMGARIDGAGSASITIEGVDTLHPVQHTVMPDRIEAGTFMVAAALTGGDVVVANCNPDHLAAVTAKLLDAGVDVKPVENGLRVRSNGQFKPFSLRTAPFPGFPTDMQAQFTVLALAANGKSEITETIFENRFMHVPELSRMNAQIRIAGRTASIQGPATLSGATVMASDLRASAALILAGLIARNGTTRVRRVYHLDRGYERIEKRLRELGANIRRVKER